MEQAPIREPEVVVVRRPRFLPPDILWYFGAIVAAVAADALILDTSAKSRGVWQFLVGLACIAVFGVLAAALVRLGRLIPGGVLAAALVWLVPATEVGFERLCGVHPRLGGGSHQVAVAGTPVPFVSTSGGSGFHGAWFSIAMGTVVVGIAVYWLVRFAWVLLPVAIAFAVSVQFFVPAVVSRPQLHAFFTAALITGIAYCVLGLLLDARGLRPAAFWWYVVGLFEVATWFSYKLVGGHHWVWVLLLVVAAAVLLVSAPLGRAVWAAYAVVGVYAALVHYTDEVTGSWKAALVLTLIGLAIVAFGLVLEAAGAELVGRVTRPWPGLRRPTDRG